MVFVKLTDDQRKELEQLSRQAVGRVALRAQMVLLSDRHYPVPFIATIHGCGCDVVRTWLHRYEQKGIAGLEDEPRSGRPPKDPLARHIIDAQASQWPQCSGHVQSCWTVALPCAFLAVRFCLRLSCSSVRRFATANLRYLKAMGWHWARPQLAPASVLRKKRDPQAAVKLAKIAEAATLVAQGMAHLLYLDESELHLLPLRCAQGKPLVRAMWMKGPRVRVPTPGRNASPQANLRSPGLLWGIGCCHRDLPLGGSRPQAGGVLCGVSGGTGNTLPYRTALLGNGQCTYPYGQESAGVVGYLSTPASTVVAQVRCSRTESGRAHLGLDERRGGC